MSNTILNKLLLIFKKHLTKSTVIKDSVAFYIHTSFPYIHCIKGKHTHLIIEFTIIVKMVENKIETN